MSENSLRIREKYISKLFKKIQDLEEGIDLLGQVDRRILRNSIQTGGAYLNNLEARSMYLQRGGSDPLGGSGGSGSSSVPLGSPSRGSSAPVGSSLSSAGLGSLSGIGFGGGAGGSGPPPPPPPPGGSSGGGAAAVERASLREIQEAALVAKSKIRSQEDELKAASDNITALKANTGKLKNDLLSLRKLVSSITIKEFPEIDPGDIPTIDTIPKSMQYNSYWTIPWEKLRKVPEDITEDQFITLLENPPNKSALPAMDQATKDKLIAPNEKTNKPDYTKEMYEATCKNILSRDVKGKKDATGKRLPVTQNDIDEEYTRRLGLHGGLTRKYLSNSVTSSEMPDNNYMLSETSFF